MGNIIIKGNRWGIYIYVNTEDYEEAKKELSEKIDNSRDFFTGSKLKLVEEKSKLNREDLRNLAMEINNLYSINIMLQEEGSRRLKEDLTEGKTRFIRNTIRSGQKIVYNGNLVVIGDVNSGAEISASGNIIVLGVLRGIAHAGCEGNQRAFVAAYILQPALLRIAGLIARGSEEKDLKIKVPEVAFINSNNIIVEPYLPNKYL